MAQGVDDGRLPPGVVAYFARVDDSYLLSEEELRSAVPLQPVFQGSDGALYRWGGPPDQ